jgi:hypothetical protein
VELSTEELQFVNAVMVMTAGNVFYSIISPKIWRTGSQDGGIGRWKVVAEDFL